MTWKIYFDHVNNLVDLKKKNYCKKARMHWSAVRNNLWYWFYDKIFHGENWNVLWLFQQKKLNEEIYKKILKIIKIRKSWKKLHQSSHFNAKKKKLSNKFEWIFATSLVSWFFMENFELLTSDLHSPELTWFTFFYKTFLKLVQFFRVLLNC
jgi:hypothetical protein